MTDLVAPPTTEAFTAILDELRRLSRDHLPFYRLEVGRLLLDRFFHGSAADYRDRSNAKETRFAAFATTCAEEMRVFGPAVSASRIEAVDGGKVRIELKNSWRDGTTHVVIPRADLVLRMAAQVPLPKRPTIRYHGCLRQMPSCGRRSYLRETRPSVGARKW